MLITPAILPHTTADTSRQVQTQARVLVARSVGLNHSCFAVDQDIVFPTMALCHPCLLQEEVLLPVLSTLPKAGLAAAALTCRAWMDPALDLL